MMQTMPHAVSAHGPRSTAHSPSSAFTLIEVLVAMAVLAIMVLMVANIFQSASDAVSVGTRRSDMNTAARAALDFMARELESAVAGPVDTLASPQPVIQFKVDNAGPNKQEVYFMSLAGNLDEGRALRGIVFYRLDNRLMYARRTGSFDPYAVPPDKANVAELLTNVLDFYVVVYTNDALDPGSLVDQPPELSELPVCADIGLELMSQDDMVRYVALNKDDDFRAQYSRFYSTRVYFINRQGFRPRGD